MGTTLNTSSNVSSRVRFAAVAYNHSSEIISDQDSSSISLINVNHQGARLRMQRGQRYDSYPVGRQVRLNLRINDETQDLAGQVSWISGEDVFVDFGSPLATGLSELQAALAQ